MMKDIESIDRHIRLINDSLAWATDYRKESFPYDEMKRYRRKLTKIKSALSSNCSAAAYGESQVGKSYLMGSLLSSPEGPLEIKDGDRAYSFTDELNSSGGQNSQTETTGVITRFTVNPAGPNVKGCVGIRNLSVVDIVLMLADSYYNDVRIDTKSAFSVERINQELSGLSEIWEGNLVSGRIVQNYITEDDVNDIYDYIETIGGNALIAYQSKFCEVIAPVIQHIPVERWMDVFGLLWNRNKDMDGLFSRLIDAYRKIAFSQEVYVPFDAVIRDKGTLLNVDWLKPVCGDRYDAGKYEPSTDVYDRDGNLIAEKFRKGDLSPLIAELIFELPPEVSNDKSFLKHMDLLDFPGARSREEFPEARISEVLYRLLKRGKVAYLFNKYSRSLQISSVLFCHHNDQKTEKTLGNSINAWIEENIGKDPEKRMELIRNTGGIAPLFMVATKFNKDLEHTKIDLPGSDLSEHWKRFDVVIPELVNPNDWFENWIKTPGGKVLPFRNIYPLRDFYWSGKNEVFDGYSEKNGRKESGEYSMHRPDEFEDYPERLMESFLENPFVKRHFSDPEKVWEDVATPDNDGSKPIIEDLNKISGLLDNARREKYRKELIGLKELLINALQVYKEPEDAEEKNRNTRMIAGNIRLSLSTAISRTPVAFGRLLDMLMVDSVALRDRAYDIVARHASSPQEFTQITFIQAYAGIDIHDSRENNVRKLLRYYIVDSEEDLRGRLAPVGLDLEDVISKDTESLSSISEVLTKDIIDYWKSHLKENVAKMATVLPHADKVVEMLVGMFDRLDIRQTIASRIRRYTDSFSIDEQPNAIGDYCALTLNDFVSNVGCDYIPEEEFLDLQEKAKVCGIPIDLHTADRKRQVEFPSSPLDALKDTLKVLDESSSMINNGRADRDSLRKLPFWNNYQRWENLLFLGLIYTSGISVSDPDCNRKVKELIENSKLLYSES